MSLNRQIESARAYHAETAHSPRSVRTDGHVLEWEIKPAPFKIYPDLEAISLPQDLPALDLDTLEALAGGAGLSRALDLDHLAALLFFSAGVTKRRSHPGGGELHFRAAPSTGALYQTEVYVVAGAVEGLPPGVYHFCPGDFALRRLRAGDFRGAVAVAAADDRAGRVPATLVLSGLHWRNAWKYRARAYRHLFWDAGAMLANALSAAAGLGYPAWTVTGFVDSQVNGLLGLDPGKEGALVLVPIGADGQSAAPPPVVVPLQHPVVPLSSSEVDYPAIREAYAHSSLDSEAEVMEWREQTVLPRSADSLEPPRVWLPTPLAAAGRGLGETIVARGSTREFSGAAISAEALSTALYHATRPWPGDAPQGLVSLYVNVHAVEGITPGGYVYRREDHALGPLKAGDLRRDSAFLCLEQPLGGSSSATVFFLADLGGVLERFGNRGYRLANLEAGLVGGRLYLGAYAQRFGATGLTFYDDAVVAFFSPHAAGKDAIFVTALGRSAALPGPRPF